MFYVDVCWYGPYCSSKTLTDSDEQVLLFSSAFAAHEYMRTKHGALNSGVNEDGIERGDLPLDFEACYFLVKCKLFNNP